MTPEDQVAFEAALSYFYYDQSSPTGLRWKNGNGVLKGPTKRVKDDVAGWFDSINGYCNVKLFGKAYRAHRIIMALHGYEIFDKQVDHIDGNRANNAIENLRVADTKLNRKNSKKRSDNRSGNTGVSYHKGASCWTARWTDEFGIERTKAFNIKKYADFAQIMAICYRQRKIQLLNEAGHGYSERHGK